MLSADGVVQRLAVTGVFTGLTDGMRASHFTDSFQKANAGKDARSKTFTSAEELPAGVWMTMLTATKRDGSLKLRLAFKDQSLGNVEAVFSYPDLKIVSLQWAIGGKELWGASEPVFLTMLHRLRRACLDYMGTYRLNTGLTDFTVRTLYLQG